MIDEMFTEIESVEKADNIKRSHVKALENKSKCLKNDLMNIQKLDIPPKQKQIVELMSTNSLKDNEKKIEEAEANKD